MPGGCLAGATASIPCLPRGVVFEHIEDGEECRAFGIPGRMGG